MTKFAFRNVFCKLMSILVKLEREDPGRIEFLFDLLREDCCEYSFSKYTMCGGFTKLHPLWTPTYKVVQWIYQERQDTNIEGQTLTQLYTSHNVMLSFKKQNHTLTFNFLSIMETSEPSGAILSLFSLSSFKMVHSDASNFSTEGDSVINSYIE